MKATISQPPPVVVPPRTVTVEMTEAEARLLRAMMGASSGTSTHGLICQSIPDASVVECGRMTYDLYIALGKVL